MKFLLLILILFSSHIFAEPKSLSFKDLEIGSDISDVKADVKYTCKEVTSPLADTICNLNLSEYETIAGAEIKLLLLYYSNRKLNLIDISLEESSFTQVVSALKEKYGRAKFKSEKLQNRM